MADNQVVLTADIFLDMTMPISEREHWLEGLRRRIRHWAEDGAPVVAFISFSEITPARAKQRLTKKKLIRLEPPMPHFQVGDVLTMMKSAPLTPGWWEVIHIYDRPPSLRVRCLWSPRTCSHGSTTVISQEEATKYTTRHLRKLDTKRLYWCIEEAEDGPS